MALPNYPNNPSVNDTFVNGGAGDTLYVKEYGSGNTGWVVK